MRRTRPLRVGFQGERGAFSELAARAMLGARIELVGFSSIARVFEATAAREVETGIVPIENSLGGSVHDTYDLLLATDLTIGAEHSQKIEQCLMARPGTTLSGITRVYSHPQALLQCAGFLRRHARWESHAIYDTAGAAKLIARERLDSAAAIASSAAARIYGLRVLRAGIADDRQNFTRFVRIGRERPAPTGKDRTSVVFATRDIPGALFKALSIFAIRDINLKKLESRPSRRRPWDYIFYLDFEGHFADEPCRRALEHLAEISRYVKPLGSYPARC